MAGKKVMIVDDDTEFLEELNETMSMSGYEIIPVNDSVAAVEIASRTKPDLIILDLKMPGRSGFQLAEEIRRLPELEKTPIIAMSSFFKEEYAFLLSIFGIKKCLKKPFKPLDVINAVEAAIG
ncbi:MAG: response regulator [Candidatus Omnitrophota bacterium]|jgi:DNA-binding response OmpR family regulator